MRRRELLCALGGAGIVAVAGCTGQRTPAGGGGGPESPTPVDSDGDGIPDREDYAPRDPAVQVKADVQRTPTPSPSPTATATATATPSPTPTAARTATPTATAPSIVQADTAAAEGFTHHLLTYSREHVELRIYGQLLDGSYPDGAEVIVLVQGYPGTRAAGDVFTHDRSDVLSGVVDGTTEVSVGFDRRVDPDGYFYYSCLLIPAGDDVSELSEDEVDTLCESDRLRIRNGDIRRDRHSEEPESLSTTRYSRENVEGQYLLTFSGSTLGESWDTRFTVFKRPYVEDVNRQQYSDYRDYVYEAIESGLADDFARIMDQEAEVVGFTGAREKVEYLVDFTQNLPYVPDDVSTGFDDYTKRPTETLVEGGGDCEDSSILLASLLVSEPFGYGTALLILPGHMAIGVKGGEDVSGSYFEQDGVRYYYVETTGRGWSVGEIPDEYQDESAYVYVL